MKYKVHGGRALLNKPGYESTACIVAEIENSAGWKRGQDRDGNTWTDYDVPNVVLDIADCSRKVALDLRMATEGDRENAVYKLDTMIRLLSELRTGVLVEQQRHCDRLANLKDSD